MLRIAIADDDKNILVLLKSVIKTEFSNIKVKTSIECFSGGDELLQRHSEILFDVIFLDIFMPAGGGFETASEIRALSNSTYIIFITSNEDAVYDTFDFQPFHFIRKGDMPFLIERITSVIKKLNRHIKQNTIFKLQLSYNNIQEIIYRDILFINSFKNYLEYNLVGGEAIKTRGKLSDIQKTFLEYDLVRIHSRYIVNMYYISKIDLSSDLITLKNDKILEISTTYRENFLESYTIFKRVLR